MKYVCLVYQDEERMSATSEAELDSLIAECGDWVQGLDKSGHHVYSSGLQSTRTATTLRRRNGQVSATDGPFAETKEFLAGFTILEARDLNEAIQLASKLPAVNLGSVEVRPLLDLDTDMNDPLDCKIASALRRVQGQAGLDSHQLSR